MSEKKLALQPGYAALTACVGAAAGLIGSVLSDEISAVPPFIWLRAVSPDALGGLGLYFPSVIFLVAIVVFGWLFAQGFRAQLEAQRDVTAELKSGVNSVNDHLGGQISTLDKSVAAVRQTFEEQLTRLEESVRSLPPDDYLVEFEEQFSIGMTHASKAFLSRNAVQDRANISSAIVVNLVAILSLALAYDGPSKGVRYGITVMIYRRLDPKNPVEGLRGRFIMVEPNLAVETLAGYLELMPEFCFEAELRAAATPMAGVKSICLPVPLASHQFDEGRTTVLPGAPTAFLEREVQYFENASELEAVIESQTALRTSVAQQARNYFSEHSVGSQIKSFISIPFGFSTADGEDEEPVGVINVHSTEPALLGGKRAELYAPLTMPMRMLLAVLWQQLSELPAEEDPPVAIPSTL